MYLTRAQLEQVKHALKCVRKTIKSKGPDPDEYGVPHPDQIDMSKLGKAAGIVITDSCNHARAKQRLIQNKAGGETHTLDCMGHLRCVIVNNMLL